MKKCSSCGNEKPYSEFYKGRAKDGYAYSCKECADEANKKTRHKHVEKTREHRRRYKEKVRLFASEYKAERGCLECGEKEPVCLDLHHLDPNEKEKDPSDAAGSSITKFLEEAVKCVVLCSNCHRKVHAGIITLE